MATIVLITTIREPAWRGRNRNCASYNGGCRQVRSTRIIQVMYTGT